MRAANIDERMANDPARDDELILVDGLDREIGSATKMQTHVEGLLHRALSVVLLREGERGPQMLLAKRAEGKYHSAGLWANSCCSHPRIGEKTSDAAFRRVREELGCEVRDLREICAFAYRAEFANGLCEYEYDHVFTARCAGEVAPDASEVSEAHWVDFDEVAAQLARHPERFAAWAPMVLTQAMSAV